MTDIILPPEDENLMVPEDDLEDVNFLIVEYIRSKGMADEAKKKAEAARDKLLALVEDKDSVKRIITDRWIVPVIASSNTGYDWAAMPESLKAELAKYKTRTPYKMLRGIKPQGMDEE